VAVEGTPIQIGAWVAPTGTVISFTSIKLGVRGSAWIVKGCVVGVWNLKKYLLACLFNS